MVLKRFPPVIQKAPINEAFFLVTEVLEFALVVLATTPLLASCV